MKQDLERLLAQNDTFMVEGVFNKNKLAELAYQYNLELLKNILMSDVVILSHFLASSKTVSWCLRKIHLTILNNKEVIMYI
ncbi:TPA: hypothetical protein ACPXF4_001848 [Streptococcus suis]